MVVIFDLIDLKQYLWELIYQVNIKRLSCLLDLGWTIYGLQGSPSQIKAFLGNAVSTAKEQESVLIFFRKMYSWSGLTQRNPVKTVNHCF